MTIALRPDREAWLQARVATGEFVSVPAARQLLAERIAEVVEIVRVLHGGRHISRSPLRSK